MAVWHFHAELASRGDRLQTEVHQVNIRARYLRFTIHSGHGEFATVNRYASILLAQSRMPSPCGMQAWLFDHERERDMVTGTIPTIAVCRVSVVGESLAGDDAGQDDDEVGRD